MKHEGIEVGNFKVAVNKGLSDVFDILLLQVGRVSMGDICHYFDTLVPQIGQNPDGFN